MLPPVPKLVLYGEEPELICELQFKWPVQTLTLMDAIVAADGALDVEWP